MLCSQIVTFKENLQQIAGHTCAISIVKNKKEHTGNDIITKHSTPEAPKEGEIRNKSGPTCSKLMMLLVNVSLKL